MGKYTLFDLCSKYDCDIPKNLLSAIENRDILKMTDIEWFDVFINMKKMQRITVDKYIRIMSNLYDSCFKDDIISKNPFDSIILKSENILASMNKDIYVSPEDIDNCIECLPDKIYGGCLVRLFYEGAQSKNDIFNLTLDKIDLVTRKIYFDNYTISMSDKLYKAIVDYNDLEDYSREIVIKKHDYRDVKLLPLKQAYENSFVKILDESNAVDNFVPFQNLCKRIISKTGFTQARIYTSGLINFLYSKCDDSLSKFEELVEENDKYKTPNDLTSELFKQYANEYGAYDDKRMLKYRYQDYIRDFKQYIIGRS